MIVTLGAVSLAVPKRRAVTPQRHGPAVKAVLADRNQEVRAFVLLHQQGRLEIDRQVDGRGRPHANRINRTPNCRAAVDGRGAGVLVEIAEHDDAGQIVRGVTLRQIGQRGTQRRDLPLRGKLWV